MATDWSIQVLAEHPASCGEGIYVDNCGLGLNYHNITENYLANVNQVAIDLRNMGVATTIVSGNKVFERYYYCRHHKTWHICAEYCTCHNTYYHI